MKKILKIILCILNPHLFRSYIRLTFPLFELRYVFQFINKLSTLIDVGSNKGQFSILARLYFPKLKIYSFEPQLDQLNIQKKNLGKKNIKYFNNALGNKNKKIKFFITKRKDSSSLLHPHLNLQSYKIINVKQIFINSLDNILKKKNIKKPIILKIDTQGYELEVLKGSKNILAQVDYILCEVSYLNAYKKQVKANNLINYLKKKSFKVTLRLNKSLYRKKLFQEDILFRNSKTINKSIT